MIANPQTPLAFISMLLNCAAQLPSYQPTKLMRHILSADTAHHQMLQGVDSDIMHEELLEDTGVMIAKENSLYRMFKIVVMPNQTRSCGY